MASDHHLKQGLALLLNLARRVTPPIRPLCFDLMEAIGMYDVSPEDVDMLLSLSVPADLDDDDVVSGGNDVSISPGGGSVV